MNSFKRKVIDYVLLLCDKFNKLKMNDDIDGMKVTLYELRVLHGKMLYEHTNYILKKKSPSSKKMYNISVYNCLIDTVKNIINNIEKDMEPYIDKSNIEQKIKPKMILFYTKWCGYSVKFMPVWEQLEKEIKNMDVDVNVMKINCEEDRQYCKKYGVSGYPTVKLIIGDKIIDYDKPRTIDSLCEFIMEHCSKKKINNIIYKNGQ